MRRRARGGLLWGHDRHVLWPNRRTANVHVGGGSSDVEFPSVTRDRVTFRSVSVTPIPIGGRSRGTGSRRRIEHRESEGSDYLQLYVYVR